MEEPSKKEVSNMFCDTSSSLLEWRSRLDSRETMDFFRRSTDERMALHVSIRVSWGDLVGGVIPNSQG